MVNVSASRNTPLALAMADQLAQDETSMADIDRAMLAKDEIAIGPINLYLDMKALYGEKLNETPIPGQRIKNEDGSLNMNPDEYRAPKAGSTSEISRYWSYDFTDGLPQGKVIREALEKAAETKRTSERDGKRDEGKYTAQRTALRRLVRQSFGLHHQIAAINGYPGAKFEWVVNEKNEVDRTNKPICVENMNNPKQFAYYTVQQFLALDVATATANGGTYKNLMDTVANDGSAGSEGDADKIENVEQLDNVAAQFLNYLENDDNHITLKRALSKQGDFADRLLMVLNSINDRCEEVLTAHAARIVELKKVRSAATAAKKVA